MYAGRGEAYALMVPWCYAYGRIAPLSTTTHYMFNSHTWKNMVMTEAQTTLATQKG